MIFWNLTILTGVTKADILIMPKAYGGIPDAEVSLLGHLQFRELQDPFWQGGDFLKKKKTKYSPDMPKMLYRFFLDRNEDGSAPSFAKFARSIGCTTEDVEEFRRHKEFDRAYREAKEIRRDYLIDQALCKRYDPSFVKYLISEENSSGNEGEEDSSLSVVITVCDL